MIGMEMKWTWNGIVGIVMWQHDEFGGSLGGILLWNYLSVHVRVVGRALCASCSATPSAHSLQICKVKIAQNTGKLHSTHLLACYEDLQGM